MSKIRREFRKVAVTIGGGSLLIIGIIAIPYPGPGWLIVFAALGILAQEYTWARRALEYAKGKYDAWASWARSQGWPMRATMWAMTALIVIVTIWLVNGYGLLDTLFGWDQTWLHSPIFGVLQS